MTITNPAALTPKSILNAAEAATLCSIQPPRLLAMKTELLAAGATVTGGKRNSKWSIPVSALIKVGLLDNKMKPMPRERARRRTKEEILTAKLVDADAFVAASETRVREGKKAQAEIRRELANVRAKKRANAEAEVERARRVLAEYEPLLAG